MAMQSEMSKTYQYRKVVKPLLERKRRARINKCLDELKDLMVECLTQEGEHITRLEKADILELTVDHLRKLKFRKQQTMTDSFRSGYIQAANEVSKALAVTPGLDITLGTELMSHLGHRLNFIQTSVPPADRTQVPGCDSMYMPAPSPASSGYSSESEAGDQPASDNINNSGLSKEKMWRPW